MTDIESWWPEEDELYLYKYLPFSTGSLKTISEGTIKFSAASEFNDPFDCRPFMNKKPMTEALLNRPDVIKRAGDQLGLSPAKRIQNRRKIAKRIEGGAKPQNMMEIINRKWGILSLSTDARNILMWSHYADYHRGFVLEFRVNCVLRHLTNTAAARQLIPAKVFYSKSRPAIVPFRDENFDLIRNLLLTKYEDWAYEKEYRVFDYERQPGIHSYDIGDTLISVIAGLTMKNENYQQLNGIIEKANSDRSLNIDLFKIQEYPEEFGLFVPNHPRLGKDTC